MTQAERRKEYLKKYKEEYKKTHKKTTLTLTNEEYKYFKAIAKKEKLKLAELIRNLALKKSEDAFIPNEIQERLDEFIFLIRNIANNVNQIARHSNTIKKLIEENSLLMWLKKIEDTVKDYIKQAIKDK